MRVGIIDVGTNSVRRLVADVDAGSRTIEAVDRDLVITRLGEGVDAARALGEEPMRRTTEAIAAYAARCRELRAARVRIIATSAVRDAANRDLFLDSVAAAAGERPEVLSGEREAALGFLGATLDLGADGPVMVCDIGGGSTELVRGSSAAERWVSLDIGSVRLTERHIGTDPPEPDEVEAVRADADAAIAGARDELGGEPAGTLVGLAGTITTVAAISLGLTGYDRDAVHRHVLQRAEIADIRARLAAMTSEQRRDLPAMPRGREDVIVAGVVILEVVMDRSAAESCVVSESDILDGTALDTARDGTG